MEIGRRSRPHALMLQKLENEWSKRPTVNLAVYPT